MNEQTIRTITIRGTSEGLDKLTGDLQKLAAAEQNVAVVSDDLTKRQISLEQAYKRQTLRLDEAARAQANIAKETKLANDALRQGVATPEQHARSLELINQRYATVTQSTQQFTQQTGLARHELINLGRQAQDVGVSLVSGQSPLMVLAQQGSQIADVFIASGKSVGAFFTQAVGWARPFVTSTAGIVTGIAAIGAAAVYAASQFLKASTTIEQALENEIRLLKEGKALIDQRTSLEARAQLNPKDLTEYEIKRNLLDVQRKLNEEARSALIRTAPRPNIAGDIRGEFAGEAPLTPGMDKVIEAAVKLKAAQAAGLPGMKEFNAELGRIATAHPELAKTVDKMIELGRTGIELENAEMRLKAISDALKGVATDAQLAAVGLGSVAQYKLNSEQAQQARDAAERQAKAVLEMVKAYPGMSIEVAKQLDALHGSLLIAKQRTGLEQINVQAYLTQNSLLLQGKTLEEAMAVAAAERAVSLARVNTEADRQLKTLQNEGEVLRATSEMDKARVRAAQEYNKLIEDGVDSMKAGQIAAQMTANARATEDMKEEAAGVNDNMKSWSVQADEANDAINRVTNSTAQFNGQIYIALSQWGSVADEIGKTLDMLQGSQFKAGGYTSSYNPIPPALLDSIYGAGGYDPATFAPNAQGREFQFNKAVARGGLASAVGAQLSQGVLTEGALGAPPVVDTDRMALLQRSIGLLPQEQQIGATRQLIGQLESAPSSLATLELIKQLNDQLEQLTKATDANTSATSAMTDVLSPFYSSDPRRTHLGFRAFAGGGIMTQYGELPLRQYQGGGMATSPQVAVFGEGSTPEAYVPVPSGRIPVELKTPANSNQRPVNVTINVMGNADAGTVAALKQTSFQKAQQLRRITG